MSDDRSAYTNGHAAAGPLTFDGVLSAYHALHHHLDWQPERMEIAVHSAPEFAQLAIAIEEHTGESLPGGPPSRWALVGLPVVTDELIPPGTVEIRPAREPA